MAQALRQFERTLDTVARDAPISQVFGEDALDLLLYLEEFYSLDLPDDSSIDEYVAEIARHVEARGYGIIYD
ncbi:MAG: hypothetical protein RLP09_25945 [Sandaracinaceae bacterium]